MRKKIYIAHDDGAFIELMSVFLEGIGYEGYGSTELLSLLLLDSLNLPDVFLLNVQLWGEDSKMIYNYLKSNESTETIPVILFSTLKRSAQNSFDHYADSFISIPFEINELPGLLKKALPERNQEE
ncbi:two-component system, OmpR family, alkaline phosphatase synthesis response regulator PhoP [Mucilaginibacter sp. OK268]|jgi:two-component system alkaline phosphatase synthesis response regulator PhoP|uniref:response regulator n=1 Tax=Mucilaginibacter sp. OK268 TaxID=1881048 RepID=UPI00088FAE69|nr:response regulator [Mucilaginibacter sp. OK268]SDP44638.1 two-component system, OmpR family, alkaline phosphatase synthesis response regulator PhoP [Mucilaginibacter sp. OK268]